MHMKTIWGGKEVNELNFRFFLNDILILPHEIGAQMLAQ